MACKVTWMINTSTGQRRVGGFSETWYTDDSPQTAMSNAKEVAKKRAAFLPSSAAVIGIRVQELGKRGFAETITQPGGYGTETQDIPQMAALCICKAAGAERYKRFMLRSVPDAIAHLGDYIPTVNYQSMVAQYFGELVSRGFKYRGVNTSVAPVNLISVDAFGVFFFGAPVVFAANDYIQILGGVDTGGNSIAGTYFVQTKVDAQNGTFKNWPHQAVQQSGTVRKYQLDLTALDSGSFKVLKLATRKIGRPFDLYRGRASKR